MFCMGQNPAVGGSNADLIREALPNLEWMVVRDIFENETASYWYESPEVTRGELRPEDIKTEIFLHARRPARREGRHRSPTPIA